MHLAKLVVVATFTSEADALIAKGVLDSTGVESMVRTDDVGGMYPTVGSAELLVRSEDRRRAMEVLGWPPPEPTA
jgi:hypothetical protein